MLDPFTALAAISTAVKLVKTAAKTEVAWAKAEAESSGHMVICGASILDDWPVRKFWADGASTCESDVTNSTAAEWVMPRHG